MRIDYELKVVDSLKTVRINTFIVCNMYQNTTFFSNYKMSILV